jgi:hypothetical protein
MEIALNQRKSSRARPRRGRLTEWLRRAMGKLKPSAVPPESWERGLSPVERQAAKRRIDALINSIAEQPRRRLQRSN